MRDHKEMQTFITNELRDRMKNIVLKTDDMTKIMHRSHFHIHNTRITNITKFVTTSPTVLLSLAYKKI